MTSNYSSIRALSEVEPRYTAASYYRWLQDDMEEPIYCLVNEGRHAIAGYRILQIPEFNEIQDERAHENYIECLLRQKTFIDTVNNVFLNAKEDLQSFVELRITNNPQFKTIDCFLLLRLVLTSASAYYDHTRLQQEFKQLIPDDYNLEELSQDEINELLKLDNKSVVEIRKNTSFFPVGAIYQPDTMVVAPRNMVDWDMKTRFYIPCVTTVEPKIYNLSNLYKMLQNARDKVQVRISLGSCRLFELEKNLSLQYHSMMKATYSALNAPDINNYIDGFSKYASSNFLFTLKMQVAAHNEILALSVANAFCGQLSFGEFKSQTSLNCFSLKNRNIDTETKRLDWEECNHHFYPYSYQADKYEGIDEATESYMLRLPYLCSGSEAMALFRLPIANAAGLPGLIAKPLKPFYQPNPKKNAAEEIHLGKVITSSVTTGMSDGLPYSFPVSDLTKHGLIVGTTGSGKTNTTLNFVSELVEKDIPFLLIEPVKSEYYKQIAALMAKKGKQLHRFNFNNPRLADGSPNPEFLRFNPLVPQQGISTTQHLAYIKSCFMAAFPMYGIMPLVLEDCLYEFFKQDKLPRGKQADGFVAARALSDIEFFDPRYALPYWVPLNMEDGSVKTINQRARTMMSFSRYVSQYLNDNAHLFDNKTKTELEGSLNRRFIKLTKGLLGQVFCPENWKDKGMNWATIPDNLDVVLNKPCVIELEALPENEDKALMMAFVLTFLFENRMMRPSHGADNQLHVTIIEEAHRLLSSSSMKSAGGGEGASMSQDSGSKTINLFIDMLAEIRAKNEAIFIVEQSPTKLVADAIKNTNLKIMHRLTNKSDRDYLGEAMNMDEQQSRYATTLQRGEALIFEEQLDKAILVKMNSFNK
jgi:hypothetical protein